MEVHMSSLLKIQKDERGFATIIGLFILIIVTVLGLSMLMMSQKDKNASMDTSMIKKVNIAASASLKACENQMRLYPDTFASILTKYTKNNSYKWLLVTSSTAANSERKIALGNTGTSYSVCITAYDTQNLILQIKGTGYGSNNEQKSVSALYKLNGVDIAGTVKSPKYVLYLGSDAKNFDAKFTITGDVYCGDGFHFNSGANNSVIHGSLVTRLVRDSLSAMDASGVTVDSAAYIGTGLKLNRDLTFNSKAGVEGLLYLDAKLNINKEAWFNDTNTRTNYIDMHNNTIHHSGRIKMTYVLNGTEDNLHAQIPDIQRKLSFDPANDSAWKVITTTLTPLAMDLQNNLTCDMLQKMYDTCNVSRKINGYIVVKDAANGPISISTGGFATVFTGKVIFLISKGLTINSHWFNMNSTARMFIYTNNSASIQGWGGANGNKFYGCLYLTDNSNIIMSWPGKNYIYGAIHVASKTAKWTWNLQAFTEGILNYDETILSEFCSMGILTRPAVRSSSPAPGSTVLIDSEIRPQLVGVVY
jgi:Tfp pilus assembly protein PilX